MSLKINLFKVKMTQNKWAVEDMAARSNMNIHQALRLP